MTMDERQTLEQAIFSLEAQRESLGQAVVETALAPLRARLAALDGTLPAEQRRRLTVLMADLVNFTSWAEKMDPEQVNEALNSLFTLLSGTIMQFGGQVEKYIGDAILAVFGLPQTQENDPEKAVRAALAMQEQLTAMSASFQQQHGVPLAMRIAIHTGPAFVQYQFHRRPPAAQRPLSPADDVGGAFIATGDTITVAMQMEKFAPRGGILISHDTYREVRGIFDVSQQPPVTLPGRGEALQAYSVFKARPRAFHLARRGVEGVETAMIGRQAELEQLQQAFRQAAAGSGCRMVTIIGEAGVGKSRLLYEFENWLELLPHPVRYFKGRASPERRPLPHALLHDLFAFRFNIQDSDSSETVRQKFEAGIIETLGQSDENRMKAHLLGQLLGFDFSGSPFLQTLHQDARQLRDRAVIYLNEYFEAEASQAPTVIFLEDIHWADLSSLEAVEQLVVTTAAHEHVPLLVVSLARRNLDQRWPNWGQDWPFHSRILLNLLDETNSQQLVNDVLQKVADLPDVLRSAITSRSGGNPLFIEELVKMLIENGVILIGDDHWQVQAERLADLQVPPTLTGLLQARLDLLPAQERQALQWAAVMGRIFWDQVVAMIGQADGRVDGAAIAESLSGLRGKEMVFRRPNSSFAGAEEYIFKHALQRDVVYDSILKRKRRGYHALAADWLMAQAGAGPAFSAGLIAGHLEAAGRGEQAVAYLIQAGEQAARRYAPAEAEGYFSRALALIPPHALEERYQLLRQREQVYDLQGKRNLQAEDLAALEKLAAQLGDSLRQAQVALRRATYAQAISDYPAEMKASQEAIRLAQDLPETLLVAEGHLHWGQALVRQGEYLAVHTHFETALQLSHSAQDQPASADAVRLQADGLRNLGILSYYQGDYAAAMDYYEQSLITSQRLGDRRSDGAALNNLGVLSLAMGDYGGARAYYERALRMFRETGDRRNQAMLLSNLGAVCYYQGDYAGAMANNQPALALFRETGDRRGEASVLADLALFAHHLDDQPSALGYSQQAVQLSQEIGARDRYADALFRLGHALTSLHKWDEAGQAYRQSQQIRCEMGQEALVAEAQAGLARLELAQGHLPQALEQVEQILGFLQRGNLDGSEEPMRVHLTCYQVLQAAGDPRASQVLKTAYQDLQSQAAHIADESARRVFLEKVTTHRQLVLAYGKFSSSS